MVRVVPLLGSRRRRTIKVARAKFHIKNDAVLCVITMVVVCCTVGGALLLVAPSENYSVVLLPTEEGPKKVAVPASEAFILGKPEVDSSRLSCVYKGSNGTNR